MCPIAKLPPLLRDRNSHNTKRQNRQAIEEIFREVALSCPSIVNPAGAHHLRDTLVVVLFTRLENPTTISRLLIVNAATFRTDARRSKRERASLETG